MKKKINPYDRSFGAFVRGLSSGERVSESSGERVSKSSGGRVSKSPKKIKYGYEGRIL